MLGAARTSLDGEDRTVDKKRLKGRPRTVEGGAHNPVDLYVGSRVRLRRRLLGKSRTTLGRSLDLTSQQVQKFERGMNRISASRLYDFARVLEVPIGFFFDDMPESLAGPAEPAGPGKGPLADPMKQGETVELVRAYHKIGDRNLRRSVYEVTRALAAHPRFGAAGRHAPTAASDGEENNGAERAS